MEQSVEGYTGRALELLRRNGVKPGQLVQVITSDGLDTRGLIIPRYEYADDNHIVLKLKSGYNIGLEADTVRTINAIPESRQPEKFPFGQKQPGEESAAQKKKLLLVSTGGTIASRVDYRTGAVHPALTASDLYAAVPELDKLATIEPEVVFSIYSENMTPADWSRLSSKIIELADSRDPQGVVVMMGTDTLAYTSAALSFSLMGFQVPVVIVGAQRSTDRPSSDAALNLRSAALFAVESKTPGVFVAMHLNESDERIAIHSGVRVRKNHSSRRDAFRSIDSPLVATVKNASQIVWNDEQHSKLGQIPVEDEFRLKTKFDPSVALVKFHPGFDPGVLNYLVSEKGIKGIIIEGTGLGHVSHAAVSVISELIKRGIFVGMTSQCIWGHVNLHVYETGMDLVAVGVTPLENMLAETALAKLSWILGNFSETHELMLRNFVGEFSSRIPLSDQENLES